MSDALPERRGARDVLDAERLAPGTNLLVTGPAMTGKHDLVLSLLAAGADADRRSVFVTTRKDAVASERDFERLVGDGSGATLSVVDCVTRSAGFGRPAATPNHEYVSDPGDLTGIGIATSKLLRGVHETGACARVGLHSVSTLLMYADLRRVFRFLHVLTGRISTAGFVGVFALDDTVDERERSILEQPFDARIELRETDAGRELRCRGVDVGPRTWTPFDHR
jgi:KaiC/GvpD/RAD55 family RecA-like ATPase